MISIFAQQTKIGIDLQVWHRHAAFIKHLMLIPVPEEKHEAQLEDYKVFISMCESAYSCTYRDILHDIDVAVTFISE